MYKGCKKISKHLSIMFCDIVLILKNTVDF